jgi:predicted DNA binding CopG/RHH family protein
MKKGIAYTKGEIGDVEVIDDFLPSPEELAFKEENVKITIGLSKSSVDYFKKEAKRHHTQYQKMIRRLLDFYVARHRNSPLTKR